VEFEQCPNMCINGVLLVDPLHPRIWVVCPHCEEGIAFCERHTKKKIKKRKQKGKDEPRHPSEP
jgi:hypothetical protein